MTKKKIVRKNTPADEKEYTVYFTIQARITFDEADGMKTVAQARRAFINMSDEDAIRDGKIDNTEIDMVQVTLANGEEAPDEDCPFCGDDDCDGSCDTCYVCHRDTCDKECETSEEIKRFYEGLSARPEESLTSMDACLDDAKSAALDEALTRLVALLAKEGARHAHVEDSPAISPDNLDRRTHACVTWNAPAPDCEARLHRWPGGYYLWIDRSTGQYTHFYRWNAGRTQAGPCYVRPLENTGIFDADPVASLRVARRRAGRR